MIPWFNVDKLKILRHSDRARMMKLRAALNSLSNDAMSKYNVRILGKDVSIVMEIFVTGGRNPPCSFDIHQIFNVIIQNIAISPKMDSIPGNESVTLTFTFLALDLHYYDKDLLNALYSLGFKESGEYLDEDQVGKVRTLELERSTATRKFWSILRNLYGDTDPFEGFESECSYVIYYKYRIQGDDFNRKILDV